MNTELMDRLSEYVDGTLAPAEKARVEAWLAGDPAARRAAAELAEVKRRAAALPLRPVPESVWLGVRAGIRSGGTGAQPRHAASARRRISFSLPQLAAAAVVLLAVGVGGGWMLLRPAPGGTQPIAAASNPTGEPATSGSGPTLITAGVATPKADRSYDRAINDLQRVVTAQERQLSPATVKVIQANLARIDSALTQAQQALLNDPGNPYLNDHVAEMRQRKLKLLRQTADLLRAS